MKSRLSGILLLLALYLFSSGASAANTKPIALAQAFDINEDTSIDITLDALDTEGGVLIYQVGIPTTGKLLLKSTSADGKPTYTYTPKENFYGSDKFTYTVKDSGGLVSTAATISILLRSVNDVPVAQAQSVSMTEDIASKSITLKATDVDSTSFTYAIATQPMHGTIVSISGATVTYKPNANYAGTDSFSFTAKDNTNVTSAPATVSLTMTPVNDAPVAIAQTGTNAVSLTEDGSKEITLAGTDAEDGVNVTYVPTLSTTLNGTLTKVASKTNVYLYTPKANFSGNASFTFTVKDSANLASTAATVSIVVSPVNDAPVAQAQSVSMTEDIASKSITLTATDVDSTSFTYAIVAQPMHGTIVSISGATVTYKPNANYAGTDSFTFTAKDNTNVTSAPATVSLTMTPVNDAPIAISQTGTNAVGLKEDYSKEITLAGTDAEDGINVTYVPTTSTTLNGTLTKVAGKTNVYLYTPKANFNGNASFTFTVKDSTNLASTAATVSIVVYPASDAPIAQAQAVSMTEDIASKSITLKATDVDSTTLSYAIATPPANGTILSISGATVTYKPNVNYAGADSFTFTALDGELTSAPATVSLTMTPVNDAPVATPQNITVSSSGTALIPLQGTDVDGNPLIYLLSTPAAVGTVKLPTGFGTVAGASILEYTPKAGVTTDAIMFKVKDATLTSAVAKVAITVAATTNKPPTANAGADLIVSEGTAITLTGSGSDPDNDVLSFRWLDGTTVKSSAATYTFMTPSVTADQTFTYTLEVKDGKGGVATDTVNVLVKNFAFTDANLLKCFGSTVPSDATLKALTTFTCDGVDLSTANLAQLAQLPNLRSVDLSHTKLVDITGLASLAQLTSLNLQFNDIASIAPLAGMTGLTYLNLGFNDISDIAALAGMNSLQELHLDANKISNIAVLADNAALTKLYLDDNLISTTTALSGKTNLTHLGLGYNQVSSDSDLAGLMKLQVLVLDANNLSNVSSLNALATLQKLYLRGNLLTEVLPLSGLLNLQVLELGFNQIANATPLTLLTNLTRLGLEFNNFANVSALSGLTKLNNLDLENNLLVTANGIPTMSALNGLLRLEGNRLLDDDISLLSPMTNGFNLRLEDNCLGSIALPSTIKVFGKAWQYSASRCGGTAPVALGKTSEILKNTPTELSLDASDPNGDALTYKLESIAVTGGALKTASGATAAVGNLASNALRFEPTNNYLGSGGTFTFSVTDANGEKSQVVTVQLRVIDPLLSSCFGGSIPSDAVLQATTRLDCVGKSLQDISALSFYFPNLDTLVLENNQLTDVSLLTATNFPNLIRLNLSGNPLDVGDLSALGSNLPSLIMLFLDNAQLDDAGLAALFGTTASPKLVNMNYLVLRDNALTSIEPLLHLHSLSTLTLDGNDITDIAALSPVAPATLPMPALAELSVDKNRLSVISLPRLSSLSYLQASNNCLSSAPVVRTTPTPLPNVYWANQRSLVSGVCSAYTP